MSLSQSQGTTLARVSDLSRTAENSLTLPKIPSKKQEKTEDPDVFFVQDKSGTLPSTPAPVVKPAPTLPPVVAADPKVEIAAKRIRDNFFNTLDENMIAAGKETNPIVADLALGGEGKFAAALKKRQDAVAAAESAWNELGRPEFKELDQAQKDVIGLLAANKGKPENNKEVIAILRAKLLKAAGLKNADGLNLPESGWTEDTVKNIVLRLKCEVVQLRLGEREFLQCIGTQAFGEKDEKFTMPGDLLPGTKARIEKYLKNKYGEDPNGEDPKVLKEVRNKTWSDYRTGVFGAGTAGRIDKEIPADPLEKAIKAYSGLIDADKEFGETKVLIGQKLPVVYALINDRNSKDPQVLKFREIVTKYQKLNMDARVTASKDLTAIGAPPITDADLTQRYAPKSPEPKK